MNLSWMGPLFWGAAAPAPAPATGPTLQGGSSDCAAVPPREGAAASCAMERGQARVERPDLFMRCASGRRDATGVMRAPEIGPDGHSYEAGRGGMIANHRLRILIDSWKQGEDWRAELDCPISGEIYVDPVVAADGFTYERHKIATWLRGQSTSPMTGALLPNRCLIANHALRALADASLGRQPLSPQRVRNQERVALVNTSRVHTGAVTTPGTARPSAAAQSVWAARQNHGAVIWATHCGFVLGTAAIFVPCTYLLCQHSVYAGLTPASFIGGVVGGHVLRLTAAGSLALFDRSRRAG